MATITLNFPTKEAAEGFMAWMQHTGELDYFEQENYDTDGEYVKSFDYDMPSLAIKGTNSIP